MDNELYRMMIANAKKQIESQNPLKPKDDDFDIFVISEVLGMLPCIPKETILVDIIESKY